MKKFLIACLFSICLISPVMGDDVDLPASGDLWDNWGAEQNFYGQDKNVSDEDFDKAIDSLKSKKNKRAERLRKKQIPKGEEFNQANETEIINEQADKDSLPVVTIPVEIILKDGLLPVGHYQLKGEKTDDNKVVLKLYQAQFLMAELPAIETDDYFDEETITFAKWILEGEDKLKIIYGSIDLNAYTIVDISN